MKAARLLQPLFTKATQPASHFGRFQNKTNIVQCAISRTPQMSFSKKTNSLMPSSNSQRSLAPSLLLRDTALTGSKAPKTDNTASVYLSNPPAFTEEDKEAASYLGVNNFYRGGNNHFYMIQFQPDTVSTINDYIEHTKLEFFGKIPYGTVSEVQISQSLLSNIQQLIQARGVECKALFFDKKRQPNDIQRVAELLFVIKTPGGFWNVSCHSTYHHITTNKDQLFANVLQNLRVELRKNGKKSLKNSSVLPNLDDVSISDSEVLASETSEKMSIPTPKKKKPLRKRITSRATVGNLNLVTPKEPQFGSMEGEEFDM